MADTLPTHPANTDSPSGSSAAVLRDLARVKALFQAQTLALVIGAPMPDLASFVTPANENDRRERERLSAVESDTRGRGGLLHASENAA